MSVVVDRLDNIISVLKGKEDASQRWLGDRHAPNSDRTINTTRSKLAFKGTFTSLKIIIVSGSPQRDLYVRVSLESPEQNFKGDICSGYVEPSKTPGGNGGLVVDAGDYIRVDSWGYVSSVVIQPVGSILVSAQKPGGWNGTNESSIAEKGKIRSIGGTDPAANTEISETVPTGARWELISVNFELVTSGTAANRIVKFALKDPSSNIYSVVEPVAAQTANLTNRYTVQSGLSKAKLDDQVGMPLSNHAILSAGQQFATITAGKSVGDNFGAPRYIVEDWIDIA